MKITLTNNELLKLLREKVSKNITYLEIVKFGYSGDKGSFTEKVIVLEIDEKRDDELKKERN